MRLCLVTEASLQTPDKELRQLQPVKWKVPITSALEWVHLIVEHVLPELKFSVMRKYLSALKSLTGNVRAITPAWQHIFPNNMYVRNLAEKELLDDMRGTELSPNTVKLFHAISSISKAHSMFKMPTNTERCPMVSDQLAVSNQVYLEEKKTVTIITHCHVIQRLRGAEQTNMVGLLLKKKQDVPVILLQELEALSGAGPACVSVPPASASKTGQSKASRKTT